MVEQFTTLITADNSIGYSAMYIGIAFVIILSGIAFFAIAMANYKHRSNSATWYKDNVYAYKVGFITKKAKEQEIELIYPPKADIVQAIEAEVSKDLNTQ